jgi:hypothetical protein
MFADDLIAAAGSHDDRVLGGAIGRIAARLPEAQRFCITDHVLEVLFSVCDMPLKQRIRSLGFAQLPFETVWIEWHECGQCWGVLVETETDASAQRGVLRLATQCPDDDGPMATPGHCAFDWREHPAPVDGAVPAIDAARFREAVAAADHLIPCTVAEINEMNARHGIVLEPCPVREQDPVLCDRFNRRVLGLAAQLTFSLLLVIYNKREVTHDAHVPSPQLQKARLKRGKRALLDFTLVDVSLSRLAEHRAAIAASGGRGPVRLHAVMRHPRVLPKGVVFVRAHQRGSAVAGVIAGQTRVVRP